MTSSVVDSYLEIRPDGSATVLASNDDVATMNAQVSYTAVTASFYVITAATKVAGATGDYTLAIQ